MGGRSRRQPGEGRRPAEANDIGAHTATDAVLDLAPRHTRYLPTLDGWRAVAIVVVMLQHSSDQITNVLGQWIEPVTGIFRSNGRFGVFIFFAISGFLITSLLLDERARTGKISLRSFYIRRAARILPPLVVVLAVFGVLAWTGVIALPLDAWLASLFFVNNYVPSGSWSVGHMWSLSIEEHFYVFWPLLLVGLGVRRSRLACAVLIALVIIWRFVDLSIGLTSGWTSFEGRTDSQVDGLLWGCLLALVCLDPVVRSRMTALTARWRYWVIFVVLVATQASYAANPVVLGMQVAVRPVLVALLVVGTVLNPVGVLGRTLDRRGLRWLGRISYSLYLWQQLFLVWDGFGSSQLGFVQRFPISVLCAVACAVLSYRFVEQPTIRLGRRWAARVRHRQQAGTAHRRFAVQPASR